MNLKNHNWDDLEEQLPKTEKIKKNGKKKNDNVERIREPQRGASDWREGDSYIGRQKKARGKTSRLI